MTSRIRTPNGLAIIILCIATSVIGYDILERHLTDHNDDTPGSQKWSAYHEQVVSETLKKQGCSQYILDANDGLTRATTTSAGLQADLENQQRTTGTLPPGALLADELILRANDQTLKSVRLDLRNIEQKCLARINTKLDTFKNSP